MLTLVLCFIFHLFLFSHRFCPSNLHLLHQYTLQAKKKGKLYGLGNLAANYRKGSVASTLRLTLNHGEGSSQQPELTPEMRELIHRLTQEQFTQQMASQAAVVMCVLYDRFSHAFIYLISCSGIFREVSYTSRYNFYLFDTYDVILVQF